MSVTCENCGGSGVEMYVGWENSVGERPCSDCFPSQEPPPVGRPMVDRSSLTGSSLKEALEAAALAGWSYDVYLLEPEAAAAVAEAHYSNEIEALRFLCALLMAVEHRVCKTCNGRGEIGGWVGQTAESGGYESEPCPECSRTVEALTADRDNWRSRAAERNAECERRFIAQHAAQARAEKAEASLVELAGLSQSQPGVSAVQLPASSSAQHSDGGRG